MKYTIILSTFLFALISTSGFTQNYLTGKTSLTFTDPARNRQIPADIYYPANISGTNVPLAGGQTKFPVVVFGHGFTIGTGSYAKLGDSLARHGFVAAFPSTETGFSPSHDNFGKDLSYLCTAIINTDTIIGSFFYGRLVHKAAVGGHSMGGGCSFLAAGTQNPIIACLFNMAAAETTPSATTAASSVGIPSLLFSGTNDCIVPPSVQQGMYNNLTSACKSMITINGATHCQIADNNFNCSFGQISSGCNSSSISVTTVYDKTTALLIPFLEYQLKDNCYRGVDYVSTISSLSGITAQNTCAIPVCQILPLSSIDIQGKMNGSKAIITWETSGLDVRNFEILKSNDGLHFIQSGFLEGNPNRSYSFTDEFPFAGRTFYRLKMTGENNVTAYSNTISISYYQEPLTILKSFPNPADDDLTIILNSDRNRTITLSISNLMGLPISCLSRALSAGSNKIDISVGNLPQGMYLLRVTDHSEKIQKIIRFVKN